MLYKTSGITPTSKLRTLGAEEKLIRVVLRLMQSLSNVFCVVQMNYQRTLLFQETQLRNNTHTVPCLQTTHRNMLQEEAESNISSINSAGIWRRFQLSGVSRLTDLQGNQLSLGDSKYLYWLSTLTTRMKLWCLGWLQLRSCLPFTTWCDPAARSHWDNPPSVGT